ncbi:DNA repair protein RAD52-like [Desulfosarcina variabilis str. Montpellier]|uniref:Rad52/Rad22 family DNA repair protein n=1 Tax=Desulfosarcina variabilis TaxID=2300 RepID=UPI003AFA6889
MNRELLGQPFPPEAIHQREGNFGHLIDYIEGHSVIQRLNDALDGNWSFEVVEHRVFDELDEVMVLGKLSTHGLVKSQFGASAIKRARETREIICLPTLPIWNAAGFQARRRNIRYCGFAPLQQTQYTLRPGG